MAVVPLAPSTAYDADGNLVVYGDFANYVFELHADLDGTGSFTFVVSTALAVGDGTGGNTGGGPTLPQTNVADVPTAKRIQVVDDIAAQVAGGGQATILEPDTTLAGKKFKDPRTANAPYFYECFQEANPLTGTTETWWNRFRIQ
jgi:hypothetical protein